MDTGALSFTQIDVSLPGNSDLPVQIGRRLSRNHVSNANKGGFGDWVPTIPSISYSYLRIRKSQDGRNRNLCTDRISYFAQVPNPLFNGAGDGFLNPPANAPVYKHEYNSGLDLNVGGQRIRASRYVPGDPEFTSQLNITYANESKWFYRCIDDGAGFIALAPNGRKYTFNKHVTFAYNYLDGVQQPVDKEVSVVI